MSPWAYPNLRIATVINNSITRAFFVVLATTAIAGAQWTQKFPVATPTSRTAAAMDFVPQNVGLIMFGGSTPLINDETWLYDGVTWNLLNPANSPSARIGAQLVYDYARGVAVLYGGLASNITIPPPTNETWEWDGTNWSQASPTASAGNRYRYGACFDFLSNRIVMYGGNTTQLLGMPNNQTWEYEGSTWSLVTTTGNPGPRDRPAMCFAAAIGKSVMFGGADGSGLTDTTWLYDGVLHSWTQVAIAGAKPPARNGASMTYDSVRHVCILTGGQDLAGALSDTWTFDGQSWIEQPTTTQAVRDTAFSFLPTIAQAVKFGGFQVAPNTLSNETWTIGSGIYGAGCTGTSGVPTLAANTAPLIGQSWTLTAGNINPTFNAAFLAIGLTKLPGVDLSQILNMPGCFAYTTPDLLFSMVGASGSANWTWSNLSAPIGASFYTQVLCLDPAANPFGLTVSNAVYATIGN